MAKEKAWLYKEKQKRH